MTAAKNGKPLSADARPVRRGDVTVQELDGEALVYDPTTADTHRLNETAHFIWRACDGRSTVADVAVRLIETYDVEHGEAAQHVSRMIEELVNRGLVFTGPRTND